MTIIGTCGQQTLSQPISAWPSVEVVCVWSGGRIILHRLGLVAWSDDFLLDTSPGCRRMDTAWVCYWSERDGRSGGNPPMSCCFWLQEAVLHN